MNDDCMLGVCTGKSLTQQDETPCSTKIGGLPVWHRELTAPKVPLACRNCGSSLISLVAQVYAPTNMDRSLYIFACNFRRCSLNNKGWIVIRNQMQTSASTTISSSVVPNPASADNGKSKNIATKAPSNIFESSWGDVSDDISMDDLASLLNSRDESLLMTISSPSTTMAETAVAPIQSIPNNLASQQASSSSSSSIVGFPWPCWKVDEYAEPSFASSKQRKKSLVGGAVSGEDIGDDSEEDEEEIEGWNNAGVTDDHIRELLSSYLKDEEDTEMADQLKSAPQISNLLSSNHANSGVTSNSSNTSKNLNNSNAKKTKIHSSNSNKSSSNSSAAADAEEEESEEKLTRKGKKYQVEMTFERRVALEPLQVLRYAYGGVPLWCTYPDPLTGSTTTSTANAAGKRTSNSIDSNMIPCCEFCGSQREFEMQLMPALLSLPIPSPPTASSSSSSSMSQSENSNKSTSSTIQPLASELALQEKLGNGLDFGVVAIWSCPNSCEAPNGEITYEVAIVQPPSDINLS